jgi:hypothetical protein
LRAENIKAQPLDELVYKMTDLLQSYHQDIQLAAIGFLFLEMIDHLRIGVSDVHEVINNIRNGEMWHQIQSLRGAHLYIVNKFSRF